jgi:hypothetical protein
MRVALATVAVLVCACAMAGAAFGAVRVASPSGTANTACASSAPCDLATAIHGAQSGDDVLIESGDYGSPDAPLTSTIQSNASNLTVHGPDGGSRPRIFINTTTSNAGTNGLVFGGGATTVRDLEVHNVSAGVGAQALLTSGGGSVIDHVVASTAGVSSVSTSSLAVAINAIGSTTITDTVAYATNEGTNGDPVGAEALLLQGAFDNPTTDVVRNSTIVGAPGSISFALEAHGESGSTTVTLQNTIVQGANGMIVNQDSGATITVNADHDAISGESTFSGTYNPGAGVTSAAPTFVDAAANDYHEAVTSSATIDAGAPVSPGDPSTDLDGDLRTLGAAPDIGADELPGAPSVTAAGASEIGTDHATVSGTVTAAGGASQAWLDYGTTIGYGQRTPVATVAPSASRQAIAFTVTGLAAGSSYHARITIVSQGGTVSSSDVTFKTAGGGRNSPAVIRQTGSHTVASATGMTYTVPLPVTVRCPAAETCHVNATLTVPAATATAAASGRHTAKPIVIGSAQLTLGGGKHVVVRIKLNHTGARLLRRRRKLTASFTLTARAGQSATTRRSGKLVVKVKPPAHRRR